jgi:uncharacterized protein
MRVFGFLALLVSCAAVAQNPVNAAYKGTPDGLDIDYFPNGVVEDSCRIVNGNIQGDRYSYYKDGKLFIREQFDKGQFHGKNFSLSPAGDTLFVEIYAHDTLLFLKENIYYKQGGLKFSSTSEFLHDSTLRTDPFIGKKTRHGVILNANAVEKLIHNRTVEKDFYKNGKLGAYREYLSGVLDGIYQEYYENGVLRREARYSNGKYEGDYQEYFPSGKVKVKAFHRNNYFDGDYIEYNGKGDVIKKITYKEGIIQQ